MVDPRSLRQAAASESAISRRADRQGAARLAVTAAQSREVAVMTDTDPPLRPLRRGMVITVLTREDVVVMNPERFLAAARDAYRAEHPDADEVEVTTAIADVTDAVFALLDRYGSVASEHPEV